jgi:hypothetical protein
MKLDTDPYGGPDPRECVAVVFPTRAHIVVQFIISVLEASVDDSRAAAQEMFKLGRGPEEQLDAALSTSINHTINKLLPYRDIVDQLIVDFSASSFMDGRLVEELRDAFREAMRKSLFLDREGAQDPVLPPLIDTPIDEDDILDALFVVYAAMYGYWLIDRSWDSRETSEMQDDVVELLAALLTPWTVGSGQKPRSHLRTLLRMEKRVRKIRGAPFARLLLGRNRGKWKEIAGDQRPEEGLPRFFKPSLSILDYVFGDSPTKVEVEADRWDR